MTIHAPLSEAARTDLRRRIDTSGNAHREALRRGDLVTAQQHWNEHISLIEVSMGRVERPGELTPEAST